jgi:hypothetical protein
MTGPKEQSSPQGSQLAPEEYDLAEGETARDLIASVKAYIAAGWRPLGGVAIGVSNFEDRNGYSCTSTNYVQAMVKP